MKSRFGRGMITFLTLAMVSGSTSSDPLSPSEHGFAAVSEGYQGGTGSQANFGTAAFYYDGDQFSGDIGRGVNVAAVNISKHKLIALSKTSTLTIPKINGPS